MFKSGDIIKIKTICSAGSEIGDERVVEEVTVGEDTLLRVPTVINPTNGEQEYCYHPDMWEVKE